MLDVATLEHVQTVFDYLFHAPLVNETFAAFIGYQSDEQEPAPKSKTSPDRRSKPSTSKASADSRRGKKDVLVVDSKEKMVIAMMQLGMLFPGAIKVRKKDQPPA